MNLKKISIILALSFSINSCREKNNSNCIYIEFSKNDSGGKTIRKQIDKCNNNRIVEEQEYTKIASGKLIADGYRKDFYSNGQSKSVSFYKNGIQDSVSFSYYENGFLSAKNYLIGIVSDIFLVRNIIIRSIISSILSKIILNMVKNL